MKNGTIEIDFEAASLARDAGIEEAVNHANQVENNWSEQAFEFLKTFASSAGEFMTEDVRVAAQGIIPSPPDARAWGGVVKRAAKIGVISKVGVKCKSDKVSHCAFAGVWAKC